MPEITINCPTCSSAIQPAYAAIESGMSAYCSRCDIEYHIVLWPAGQLTPEHLAIVKTLTGASLSPTPAPSVAWSMPVPWPPYIHYRSRRARKTMPKPVQLPDRRERNQ